MVILGKIAGNKIEFILVESASSAMCLHRIHFMFIKDDIKNMLHSYWSMSLCHKTYKSSVEKKDLVALESKNEGNIIARAI